MTGSRVVAAQGNDSESWHDSGTGITGVIIKVEVVELNEEILNDAAAVGRLQEPLVSDWWQDW